MGDTMILTPNMSHDCTVGENISWCRTIFKQKKFRSLSIVKGKMAARTFADAEQAIPSVMDEPVKTLGRVYDASLTDKDAVQHIRETWKSEFPCQLIVAG